MKRLNITGLVFGVSATALLMGSGPSHGQGVTEQDILNDATTTNQVVSYGLGPKAHRYSPLDQINTGNAKNLVPVWSFSFGGEKQRGQESQAMVYDGIIYVTGSYSRVYAIDAKTGNELWQYDARLPQGILPCCDVINRGVALHGDMVYFGTLDAKVVALDRKTGKVVWSKKLDDYKEGYSITAAPIVVDGKVIVTNAGGEFGVIGRLRALDAKTGEIVWERPTVEGHTGTLNGNPSTMTGTVNATWPGDMWKWGGGAPWNGVTYDPDTNLLFTGTGNPAPWNSHLRKGDNLYTASQLAINPDTGEIVWHYQNTPNDAWDYDSIGEIIPFDLEVDGKTVKAVASAQKNGFFYILDQADGKLVKAFPFVKNISWAEGIGEDGRPNFVEANRPGDPSEAEGGKGKTVWVVPNFLGGKNWNPMAYNPDTGLFYIHKTTNGVHVHRTMRRIATAAVAQESPSAAGESSYWAFQPVVRPSVPATLPADASRSAIDAFILKRLQDRELTLSPPAERGVFIRRATYDLWGLPPTPSEIDAFIHDESPDAHEKLIDRLLASPRYGERWGRYWLDVVRFSETAGFNADTMRPLGVQISRLRHPGLERRHPLRPFCAGAIGRR